MNLDIIVLFIIILIVINHYESRQHDNGRFIHIRSGGNIYILIVGKIILVMVQK